MAEAVVRMAVQESLIVEGEAPMAGEEVLDLTVCAL